MYLIWFTNGDPAILNATTANEEAIEAYLHRHAEASECVWIIPGTIQP